MGVYALHFEGIIHRDIKPKNMFIYKNWMFFLGLIFHFKYLCILFLFLGDFGISLNIKDKSNKNEKGIIGTMFIIPFFIFNFLLLNE
jgi:serine/threonine protein kinase